MNMMRDFSINATRDVKNYRGCFSASRFSGFFSPPQFFESKAATRKGSKREARTSIAVNSVRR